ncbi:metalloregulator ArsR/SmtB family transcription factor [Paenibacillus sp. P26]|nr:metalloregulator ArsR/SmtB family transcription factor [Paenibacillus sp. P26]UUZ94275.1 metalloregulator ArsR/SmtB family transcription factor [Paenibacillus sp. P25]
MLQLEKIVRFHKALADPTRLRMLTLLSKGEMNGQVLAEELGLSAATVTHHAMKLREAALIHERREKNVIFFSLNVYFLKQHSQAALDMILKGAERDVTETSSDHAKWKEAVIKNFFTKDGRLKRIPAQYKKKLVVLEQMAAGLEKGRAYTEKEINEYISGYHEDFATLRREFIMHHYMYREQDIYELNPPDLWTRWEEVR